MLPLYIFAQKGARHMPNNDNSNTLVDILTEERTKVKTLSDSIEKLNKQISETAKKRQNDSVKHKNEISEKNKDIDKLNTDKKEMSSEITKLKHERDSLREDFKVKDEFIYKRCLLYPLELQYNPEFINEFLVFIQNMNIEQSHPKEYKTYFHFLNEYKGFNKDVKDFLEGQKTELERKNGKLDMIKLKAEPKLKKLDYYKYYKKRNIDPWESIVYLDKVIDKFFNLLNSNKLNINNLQELIDKLPDTETETATNKSSN